ncbi:hypothetical protein DSECCO2_576320 [anaerobic digester metagenome]
MRAPLSHAAELLAGAEQRLHGGFQELLVCRLPGYRPLDADHRADGICLGAEALGGQVDHHEGDCVHDGLRCGHHAFLHRCAIAWTHQQHGCDHISSGGLDIQPDHHQELYDQHPGLAHRERNLGRLQRCDDSA